MIKWTETTESADEIDEEQVWNILEKFDYNSSFQQALSDHLEDAPPVLGSPDMFYTPEKGLKYHYKSKNDKMLS